MPARETTPRKADAKDNGRGARRIPGGATKESAMSHDKLALVLALLIILVLRATCSPRSPAN